MLLFYKKIQYNTVRKFLCIYSKVLQCRDPSALPDMWIFEEPLLYNNFLYVNSLNSASMRSALREAGCMKLGHLLKAMHSSLVELGQLANIRSERLMKMILFVNHCHSH